jgi:hypothetical protein
MGEVEQIRVSSLKSLILASLPLKYKEVLQGLNWCTHQIWNQSKWTKNEEDTQLELERGVKLFNFLFWSKLSLVLFFCFLYCSFIPSTQRIFVALQFVCPMTQNLLNLVNEWRKYWKMFDDGQFYPIINEYISNKKKQKDIPNYMLGWTLLYLEEVYHIKSSFKYIKYGIWI